MKSFTSRLKLDYLREYELGSGAVRARRNVRLELPDVEVRDFVFYRGSPVFGWRNAQRLENPVGPLNNDGVWPINYWRGERRLGNLYDDKYPNPPLPDDADATLWAEARKARLLLYHRVPDSDTAIRLLARKHQVRFSFELTSEWYDPPDGIVPLPAATSVVRGSHAVPLLDFDYARNRFTFPNSWGEKWGDEGYGSFDREFFERHVVEAWAPIAYGFHIPYEARSGIVCLEWKCTYDNDFGVHCREIRDAASDIPLAWTFCIKRNGVLDIDEFFVWPTERGKGYGRELAKMLIRLRYDSRLSMRMLVSFAETTPDNLDAVRALANRLELNLSEADERWLHLVGRPTPPARERPWVRIPPSRPAFPLEDLRPDNEASLPLSNSYEIFFGTDREQETRATVSFTNRRGSALTLGCGRVHIPETHRFGSFGRWWAKVKGLSGSPRTSLETATVLARDEFITRLGEVLPRFDDEPQNLLYVHGYNTSFEDSLVQAARFGVDLKIPGNTFVYSWPSAASSTAYPADESTIEASLPFLSEFIDMIVQAQRDVPLSVVVHSMGSRAVVRYLEALAARVPPSRLGNVIFAAPDVDATVFENGARLFHTVPHTATMYASMWDRALRASHWLHGYPRAGFFPPLLTMDGVDTIAVEGLDLLTLGHSYHASCGGVLHDMFVLMKFGSRPKNRPRMIEAHTESGRTYWRLPTA